MSEQDLVLFYNSSQQLLLGEKVKSNSNDKFVVRNPAYITINPTKDADGNDTLKCILISVFLPELSADPKKPIQFTYDKRNVTVTNARVSGNTIAQYKTIFGIAV